LAGELQVDQVISRLGLDRDAPMSALSGGWRRRVMLGRALVSVPGSSVARRTDQSSGHRGHHLARGHDAGIRGRAAVHQPRPRLRAPLATRIVELDRGQLRVWPGNYDDYVVQKRAALEVEAKHAALFDKKLAQEEVWIRKGVEARRTRNEGRVRALEQLRVSAASAASASARSRCALRRRPSGKLVFEAEHVATLRRADRDRRFFGAHHARRPHRHHRPERLRQDHA
jgi:ATP-binding cassette subfamily F protein uup